MQVTQVPRGMSQAGRSPRADDADSPPARVASPFAIAAVLPPGALATEPAQLRPAEPAQLRPAEPAPSLPAAAAAVERSASSQQSLAARSESSNSTKSSMTVSGALAPLSNLARRLQNALSRSSISSECGPVDSNVNLTSDDLV